MVKTVEQMDFSDRSIDRILVCITAQGNSKRLINSGAELADKTDGELHILHVQLGNNIFNNEDTPRLLEELFDFGSQKGGMIHCYCDEDVAKCIGRFSEETGITKVVFGQPPIEAELEKDVVLNNLKHLLRFVPNWVDLIIVPREEGIENICIKRN